MGPVGSLGSPVNRDEYEHYQGDGFSLFVHREILATISIPGLIPFHFGAFGWIRVKIEEQVKQVDH
ncbi:hypothetical protein JXQ70_14500 [bacterium]|nr:hypothetical protein [bacterium]